MARQTGWALAFLLLLVGSAAPLGAQADEQAKPTQQRDDKRGENKPRWLWWKDPKVMAELGLTSQQSDDIDRIHRGYIEKAVQLRRDVTDLDKAIEKMIVEPSADMTVFTLQVKRVEARRAELNERRTVMLYSIRRVLSPDQNKKFQAWWERREAARKKQDGDRRK